MSACRNGADVPDHELAGIEEFVVAIRIGNLPFSYSAAISSRIRPSRYVAIIRCRGALSIMASLLTAAMMKRLAMMSSGCVFVYMLSRAQSKPLPERRRVPQARRYSCR